MHYEYNVHQDAVAPATGVTHNTIDTTRLNNVLGRLPLFLSVKLVLVMMAAESGHILLLSAKYHSEAAK